jgi:hypothetical protein
LNLTVATTPRQHPWLKLTTRGADLTALFTISAQLSDRVPIITLLTDVDLTVTALIGDERDRLLSATREQHNPLHHAPILSCHL